MPTWALTREVRSKSETSSLIGSNEINTSSTTEFPDLIRLGEIPFILLVGDVPALKTYRLKPYPPQNLSLK